MYEVQQPIISCSCLFIYMYIYTPETHTQVYMYVCLNACVYVDKCAWQCELYVSVLHSWAIRCHLQIFYIPVC